MKLHLFYSFLIIILGSASIVESSNWCNETSVRLKEERIPYEDVVFKRKESMMCKIRGHKPPGCIVQIKVLKEHIKCTNETIVLPKCCEGFQLTLDDCMPVCTINCPSGVCSEPNVCRPVSVPPEKPKTEWDYYDTTDYSETSTTDQGTLQERETTITFADVISGTHESATEDPSTEIEVRRQTASDLEITPIKTDNEVHEETTMNDRTRKNGEKVKWILWMGMACVGVTMCVIAYIIYRQRNVQVNTGVQQVISYTK